MTKNGERLLMRYVDELTSKLEFEGTDRRELEKEIFNKLKDSVDNLISQGYDEKQAINMAIDQFDDSEYNKIEKKDESKKVDPKDLPAKLFSQVMSMVIAIACVMFFVPSPIKYIAILGIISGMGYTIINTINHNR